jgi:hypothetical protein
VVNEPATFDFEDAGATRLQIFIYAEEWGFRFTHRGQWSWIRVTDIPFAHGRDDHQLLALTPPLKYLADLVRELENRHSSSFRRDLALVRSTLPDAEDAIRRWVLEL